MEKPLCTLPDGSCLIETFRWTPGQGVLRKALHLARLARSAAVFGIPLDTAAVTARLGALHAPGPMRCRLTVGQQGQIDLTTAPMPPAAPLWRVMLSPRRLNSQDPLLRHKTSQRALYDKTRAELPDGVDEVIFLNENDNLCEGTITNILVRLEDRWLTPPVSSGCLPGVYRQFLVSTGQVQERVLSRDILEQADELRLCNSLRQEIPATMIVP